MKILRYIYEGITIALIIAMLVLTILGIIKADGVIPIGFDHAGEPTAYGGEWVLLLPLAVALLVSAFLTLLQRLKRVKDPLRADSFKGFMAFIKAHTALIICLLNGYMATGAMKGSMPKGMDAVIIAGFTASLAFGIMMWRMIKKAFR